MPTNRHFSGEFQVYSTPPVLSELNDWGRLLGNVAFAQDSTVWLRVKDAFRRVTGMEIEVKGENTQFSIFVREREGAPLRKLAECGDGLRDIVAILLHVFHDEDVDLYIEEPGTRLHPAAQRELLSVLVEAAQTRQIWITTHDPVFANTHAAVERFAVRRVGDDSVVSRITTWRQLQAQRDDLGWVPSDAVLASHVVYCEGPSDKTLIEAVLAELEAEDPRYGGVVVAELDGCGVVHAHDNKTLERVLERVRGAAPFARHVVILDDDYETEPRKKAYATRVAQQEATLHWLEDAHELEDYFLHPALFERILRDSHKRCAEARADLAPLPSAEELAKAITTCLQQARNAVEAYAIDPKGKEKPTAVVRAFKPLWKKFALGDFRKSDAARVAAVHLRDVDPKTWESLKRQLRDAVGLDR